MKKMLCILMAMCFALCLCACEEKNTIQSTTKTIKFWTDEETGVQYVIYQESGGYSGYGGITPRLNSDGTLYQATESESDSE